MMRRKANKGFTLIEIIIALVVLLIGLIGIVVVIPIGQRAAKDAAVITRASLVASEKIAEVKAYGYEKVSEDPPIFDLTGTSDDVDWVVEIDNVLDSDFSESVTLPIQNLKRITVTVSYKMKNKTRTDTFHSFLGNF